MGSREYLDFEPSALPHTKASGEPEIEQPQESGQPEAVQPQTEQRERTS
jgi:hypothetical protein